MLAWFAVASALTRHSGWLVPNLFATVLAGGDAFHDRYLKTSLAGAGLVIVVYGCLGLVWGLIWKETDRGGLVAFGGVTGIAVYFAMTRLVWNRLSPAFAVYAPDREILIAHIMWGLVLGRVPIYARRIARATEDHGAVHPLSPDSASDQSAELI